MSSQMCAQGQLFRQATGRWGTAPGCRGTCRQGGLCTIGLMLARGCLCRWVTGRLGPARCSGQEPAGRSLSARRDADAACEDCQLRVSAASRAGKVDRQLHRVLTDVPSARAAMVTLRNRRRHGCYGVDCKEGHAGKLHENETALADLVDDMLPDQHATPDGRPCL